jgi:hypothetical protein
MLDRVAARQKASGLRRDRHLLSGQVMALDCGSGALGERYEPD